MFHFAMANSFFIICVKSKAVTCHVMTWEQLLWSHTCMLYFEQAPKKMSVDAVTLVLWPIMLLNHGLGRSDKCDKGTVMMLALSYLG